MTIGQRIAQKRKELNLSQEALGEKLGVSRQAIYKWESDAALPEIDKLVALCKLFGVPVGWLLGVEEDTAPQEEPADGELTEGQLQMVEEIVSRYLAAQPKPKTRRRWWLVVVLVIAGIALFNKLDRLDQQYQHLQNSVGNISSSVNSQIGSITTRVEEILKSQNDLTAEYDTKISAVDLKANTITIAARAVPKTFVDGMTALFVVDSGGSKTEVAAQLGEGQTFSAEITSPLTDLITVSVVLVDADGTRRTQLIDSYEGYYAASLPQVSVDSFALFKQDVWDRTLTMKGVYVTVDAEGAKGLLEGLPAAEAADIRLGFFLNQKLLAYGTPCEQPDNYRGDFKGEFYRLPDLSVEGLQHGDMICVAALVTDSYGRQFMAYEYPYEVKYGEDGKNGYLAYPYNIEYDQDPANWDFGE